MKVKEIKSKIDNQILHLVIKNIENIKGDDRLNVIQDNEFIQLSILSLQKDKTFKPHKHVYKHHDLMAIAQESWVILEGSVKVTFYDIDDKVLCEEILNKHDVSITLKGGHNYLILENDTKVLEYKTGPYQGQTFDKVFINEKN